jgi:hypothetical protein
MSNSAAELQSFVVVGGEEISLVITAEGLRFNSTGPAAIVLGWDGVMEFVEWVELRLPMAEQ